MRELGKTLIGFVAGVFLVATFAGWEIVLTVFGSIFGLGVLIVVGVSAHLLIDQRRHRHAALVVSWPRVAEPEHATGVFDTFTGMEWPGHTDGVGDACRTCAREKDPDDLLPPHGGFNTPCDCDDCNDLVQQPCAHPRTSVVKATSRTIDGTTVRVEYSCQACGAENIPAAELAPGRCEHPRQYRTVSAVFGPFCSNCGQAPVR